MEWTKVYYNGLETNIEVTKCGKIRKIKVDWYGNGRGSYQIKIGEIDINKLKIIKNYIRLTIQIKGLKGRTVFIHQLLASAFLSYKWNGLKNVVDHIDSNKLNNQIDNLRVITHRENISKEKSVISGLPVGVYFNKRDKKYRSQIQIQGKNIYLGQFKTIDEASKAYQKKLNEICV